jgi:hypothetical protein
MRLEIASLAYIFVVCNRMLWFLCKKQQQQLLLTPVSSLSDVTASQSQLHDCLQHAHCFSSQYFDVNK